MPVGGAERVLVDLLNNLNYDSNEVSLLVQYKEGGLLPAINNNVHLKCLYKYSRIGKYNNILQRIIKLFHLQKLNEIFEKHKTRSITDSRYDVIISFCQGYAHKLHLYIVDKSHNNISWIHSDLLKGNWGLGCFNNCLAYQEAAYNCMNKLVFVSEGAKESFNKLFRISPNVSQLVIYNIIDKDNIIKTSKLVKISKPNNKFVFVNVGRLVEAKMQIRLLQAAKLIKKQTSDFIIWIIGEGPLRGMLENYISENNLSDVVVLLGNQMNPYAYVRVADTFVLSSRQEGFPLVVCEALILSKPVICTNIVGPSEVLEDGKYGCMVNEESDAIAETMMRFMSDTSLCARYSELAIQRSKMFDVNDFMSSFNNLIHN